MSILSDAQAVFVHDIEGMRGHILGNPEVAYVVITYATLGPKEHYFPVGLEKDAIKKFYGKGDYGNRINVVLTRSPYIRPIRQETVKNPTERKLKEAAKRLGVKLK